MQYISPVTLVVFTADGTQSFSMEAHVPTELPDEVISDFVRQGATRVGAVAAEPVAPVESDKVPAIVEAMRAILEAGDPVLLESGGIPRVAEIDAIIGFRSNKADREAAWAVVEG